MLIMIREGFEAALIVALVFAYLCKLDRRDEVRTVWIGAGAAIAIATATGIVLHIVLGGLTGVARLRSFAAISVVAALVLTWMVFWMRRESTHIKGDLERRIDRALEGSRTGALALVAGLAVLREGLEAALFLVAAATDSDGSDVVVGALLGIAIAAGLGVVVYAGGRRLPMRAFFKVTGVIVIFFAAGLLARAVLFLQADGDVGTLNNAIFDLTRYRWLTPSTEVGKFLGALVGWDPRPSIEQLGIWLAYVVPVSGLFFFGRPNRTDPRSVTADA
jgi:high-affinity iron transporter